MKKKLLVVTTIVIATLVACTKKPVTPTNTNATTNNTSDTTKTSNDESISGFDCAGIKIIGKVTKDMVVSNVTATITYSGGNGKNYSSKSYNSTGVSGLSATLLAGNLTNSNGTLTYIISGTPITAGTAYFTIAFGGKTCTINLNVENVSQTIGKQGPNIFDVEGNTYKTVYIGTQQWMAENLNVTKYNDGTSIPNVIDNAQWKNLTTGAWAYYNNDDNNNAKYGKLYNWYVGNVTTNGNKNVCPSGWHVPTDAEWTVLTNYLGGGVVAGGKMKEVGIISWNSPNTGATNSSLFTGLPGGGRDNLGNFICIGMNGDWWTSSNGYGINPFFRDLSNSSSFVSNSAIDKKYGLSLRCLKD